MLSPAHVLSLLVCAAAHTPSPGELPADIPLWGAALFVKVDAMEGEISTMKATIATQTEILKMQGETIAGDSARIQELEARAAQENVRMGPDNGALGIFSPRVQIHRLVGESNSTRPRKQSDASCDPSLASERSQSVMRACCPGGNGHRRLQADCTLPDTCGTV